MGYDAGKKVKGRKVHRRQIARSPARDRQTRRQQERLRRAASSMGRRAPTFSWFGRNRRLAKDYENLADTLAAFVTLAAIQFAIRRLARM